MVSHGKYNDAFTKALMASDLPLVVELMEMVDSSKIFSPDLPGGTALEARGDKNNQKCKSRTKTLPDPPASNFKSEVKIPMPKTLSDKNEPHSTYDHLKNDFISCGDSFF